jgi:hypothetical protein
MNDEEKITLAFIYKRSGKNKLKKSEIYLPLSVELKWFTPKEAQGFVDHALKKGLLKEEEGLLALTFQVESVSIPIGFKPSKRDYQPCKGSSLIAEDEKENITRSIITEITRSVDETEESITSKIKKIQSEKNITLEVAALMLANRYNIDVSSYYDIVEEGLYQG